MYFSKAFNWSTRYIRENESGLRSSKDVIGCEMELFHSFDLA